MAEKVRTSPEGSVCSPSQIAHRTARVISHTQIADKTFRIRLDCPDLSSRALPGQFAMVRLPDRSDPLLARPLAIYDTYEDGTCVDFIYLVHGKFTTCLKDVPPGENLTIWGPLGNGFNPRPADHLILVAGGIGYTALLSLGRERLGRAKYGFPSRTAPRARKVTFCWGARHGGLFGDTDDFQDAGIDMHYATQDGSIGHKGTVVDLLERIHIGEPEKCHVACCGPEPMMAAVSKWTERHAITCDVSLEEPMACGIGICFTCVAKIRDNSSEWDYRRTCIEGPVFDSASIVW